MPAVVTEPDGRYLCGDCWAVVVLSEIYERNGTR
jgi:hypothetical protein